MPEPVQRYKPEPPPDISDIPAVVRYLLTELERHAQYTNQLGNGELLEEANVAPVKPRVGMVKLADGTNWDPGYGRGVYWRDSSDWKELLTDDLFDSFDQNEIILGGGLGNPPTTPVGLGLSTQVLHGNAGGAPSWGAVSLTTDVSGTLPATNGGTGQNSWSTGEMLYASAANTLSKLATTVTNSYLGNGGTGNGPAWKAKAALTRVSDSNVTLTLGGSPTIALLEAASITAGWTGTLPLSRGGLGFNDISSGGIVYGAASGILGDRTIGSAGDYLKVSAGAPVWSAPAALTKVDDTNVTLTLGGSPTTALLNAASVTVGWSGTLAAARLNSNVVQGVTNDTNVTGSISTQNLTLGWTGQLSTTRGGTGQNWSASNGVPLLTAGTFSLLASTGSGDNVRAISPTLTTPVLGVATATSINFGGSTLSSFVQGTFTLSGSTGWTSTPTDTAYYTKIGNAVHLTMPAGFSGTSNATTKILSGVPAAIRPLSIKWTPVLVSDNGGAQVWAEGRVLTNGNIQVYAGPNSNGWTASGTATIFPITIAYDLGG